MIQNEKKQVLLEVVQKAKKLIGATLSKRFVDMVENSDSESSLFLAGKAIKTQIKRGRRVQNKEFAEGLLGILQDMLLEMLK